MGCVTSKHSSIEAFEEDEFKSDMSLPHKISKPVPAAYVSDSAPSLGVVSLPGMNNAQTVKIVLNELRTGGLCLGCQLMQLDVSEQLGISVRTTPGKNINCKVCNA
jgi:hypothetical protein